MSRMQDEMSLSHEEEVFAGVDVGKRHLDVFLHPARKTVQIVNDKAGIRRLVRLCRDEGVRLVALEATGRYHRLVHRHLHDAGIPAAVVNPFRSRKFADALGQIAKTDRIDAEVLASFAALLRPEPSTPPSQDFTALRDLIVARRQVLAEAGTLKRQLGETDNPIAARQIRARLKMCQRRFVILTSIPGVGPMNRDRGHAQTHRPGEYPDHRGPLLAAGAPLKFASEITRPALVARVAVLCAAPWRTRSPQSWRASRRGGRRPGHAASQTAKSTLAILHRCLLL